MACFRILSREHHDGQIEVGRAHASNQMNPFHIRQIEFQNHHVEVVKLRDIQRFFTGFDLLDQEIFGTQSGFEQLRGNRIIFNKERAHETLLS